MLFGPATLVKTGLIVSRFTTGHWGLKVLGINKRGVVF